jgi:hypothetical protein
MKKFSLRSIIPLLTLPVLVFVSGCATVPQNEFKSFHDSFADTKNFTEKLLLEYDETKRAEAEAKPNLTNIDLKPPYPSSVTLNLRAKNNSSSDSITARREALEVVSDFNEVLMSLAEGKKPEELRSVTDTFLQDLSSVAKLIKDDFSIPYVGQISALISTVITKLQEAQNRYQFVAALKEAEPVIQGILSLFAKDAEDLYVIKAKQADRQWSEAQDRVAILVRQMRAVVKEYAPPAVAYRQKLTTIEKDVRSLLDRVELKENDATLSTSGQTTFNELALSQLDQTLVQANSEADQYESVIKQQVAFHKLISSYGELLEETNTSFKAARLALDAPLDIKQQSKEFFAFVFRVKRDWEALDAARRGSTNK